MQWPYKQTLLLILIPLKFIISFYLILSHLISSHLISSPVTVYPTKGHRRLEPVLADTRQEAGCTLDKSPVGGKQPNSLTVTSTGKLKSPVYLENMLHAERLDSLLALNQRSSRFIWRFLSSFTEQRNNFSQLSLDAFWSSARLSFDLTTVPLPIIQPPDGNAATVTPPIRWILTDLHSHFNLFGPYYHHCWW